MTDHAIATPRRNLGDRAISRRRDAAVAALRTGADGIDSSSIARPRATASRAGGRDRDRPCCSSTARSVPAAGRRSSRRCPGSVRSSSIGPAGVCSDPVDFARHGIARSSADLLRGVLDGLGIDRVDVVGGSIGDVWALSLAEHHPDRVGRIVLLGGGPLVADVPRPGLHPALASPIGALIVRLPMSPDRLRSILRQNGHGPSLEAGRIPDEFIDWRLALANDTVSMRHERDMVRSILRRSGWQPGFVFDDADLGRIEPPDAARLRDGRPDRQSSTSGGA